MQGGGAAASSSAQHLKGKGAKLFKEGAKSYSRVFTSMSQDLSDISEALYNMSPLDPPPCEMLHNSLLGCYHRIENTSLQLFGFYHRIENTSWRENPVA